MKWFILTLIVHGKATALNVPFPSQDECFAYGGQLTSVMRKIDTNARFICGGAEDPFGFAREINE